MAKKRRVLWIAASAALALVLGVVGYLRSGSSAIESWVGTQILEIGGTCLGPELRFERLTYVRPRTILLDHLTLSSPDPANPGHSVVILAVRRARLELTEIPRPGQPIKFSQVTLESPEIHAVAATPGGTTLVGFSHLVKGSPGSPGSTDSTGSTRSAAAAGTAKAAPRKFSDILLMRKVEIIDGTMSYDPRTPNTPPILLDGINARLDFTPEGASSDPALYAIATTISRKPALELSLQGHLNIDTLTLELAKLQVDLDLQEKNAHFLPPALQKLLKNFEVTGQLHVSAAGVLPLANWRQCALTSGGELTAARLAVGQSGLSIDSWKWEAELAGGVATIRKSDARLLGGDLQCTGTIPLAGARPARLDLHASDLEIQQLLRASNPGQPPPYAGKLNASITFSAPLAQWRTQAGGGGTFSLRQGRIDELPLLGRIVTSLNQLLGNTLSGDRGALKDTADGTFRLTGDGVQFDQFTGASGALALRGSGRIGFDRRLELRLNAGPMEALQNSLGSAGEIWASLSDALAGYRVDGTVDDPKVSMELGGGH